MKFNSNNLKIHKLNLEDSLEKFDFDCGDEDLNNFLFIDSFKYIQNNLSIIYLIFFQEELVGYFSLSSDAIKIKTLEIKHGFYPAVKIGRLAVNKKYQNQGIGSFIIKSAISIILRTRNDIWIRFLSIDAYNDNKVIHFYSKFEFETLLKIKNRRNIPMYLDINMLR
ncbi:GNAT family N-acetyltransferase [Methanosphaera sp. ISO3-F5]|uniref:GNAT family N-acetyltransferase n=1 Tax=Methanosphaera sp. ISO3-F5 TaxID=1452353 RepID=UPI002B26453D|nr:GNAT family N-acetyltransferase [Methanosphaera sp. ISO3-F5]WQH64166.1 GNAT family N-acetyltransferase [Methanosphaera sp. ISO3-F5]